MKQAAGTAAKSRCDSHSSSPFSLSLSPSVSSSLAPTEMWIDGDPPGNSFISFPPLFAPLEVKQSVTEELREIKWIKERWKCIFHKLAASETHFHSLAVRLHCNKKQSVIWFSVVWLRHTIFTSALESLKGIGPIWSIRSSKLSWEKTLWYSYTNKWNGKLFVVECSIVAKCCCCSEEIFHPEI